MVIDYDLGGKFWHTDCESRFGGIMIPVENEESRSLIRCLQCGKEGYYPVGAVGNLCVNETTESLAREAGFVPDEETRRLLEQDIMVYGSCTTVTEINHDGTVTVKRIAPPQARE